MSVIAVETADLWLQGTSRVIDSAEDVQVWMWAWEGTAWATEGTYIVDVNKVGRLTAVIWLRRNRIAALYVAGSPAVCGAVWPHRVPILWKLAQEGMLTIMQNAHSLTMTPASSTVVVRVWLTMGIIAWTFDTSSGILFFRSTARSLYMPPAERRAAHKSATLLEHRASSHIPLL